MTWDWPKTVENTKKKKSSSKTAPKLVKGRNYLGTALELLWLLWKSSESDVKLLWNYSKDKEILHINWPGTSFKLRLFRGNSRSSPKIDPKITKNCSEFALKLNWNHSKLNQKKNLLYNFLEAASKITKKLLWFCSKFKKWPKTARKMAWKIKYSSVIALILL